jgi:predicted enzyme related to lactoylglutathione lyase
MHNPPGSFVWYELMTTDTAAAAAFYTAVAGWTARDSGQSEPTYTLLAANGIDVGGLMALPAEAGGARPVWVGYVGVDDVDAAVTRFVEAGGTIHRVPADIPGIGRFALVADPQGAVLVLFTPAMEGVSESFKPMAPGHFGWNELHTTDSAAAIDFYAGQFGWTQAEPLDMGPMGQYRIFESGGQRIGGMMDSPTFSRPLWLYYINVDNIDAALARVTANDGQVLLAPSEVPGGAFIVQAIDPQGAMFALVGSRP